MFWNSGGETTEEGAEAGKGRTGPSELERDAPRPATILKVASELEEVGGEIQELFKEIHCPWGQVVLPIHLREGEQDFFIEVETGAWDHRAVEEAINKAAVVRNSEHAGAGIEILSAYPVPKEVGFFFGRSAAALLQLALFRINVDDPEGAAALFRDVASRHWGVDLDYEPEYLPLVEELLMAALDEDEEPPILDALVVGLGCFVGETIRRSTDLAGSWRTGEDWGEGPVIEVGGFILDPIGKSRAFLREGTDDSVAFYADYVLEQLSGGPGGEEAPDPAADRP
ncbi:MAG: hypothetical protein LC714_00710 [Actinobacteria bacterium]|nr:hypothetical protein [Actinomycetota bacterium]